MPTYTPVDPLPTAPSRKRPAAFSSETDDFLAKLPEWGQQVSDIGVQAVIASIDAIAASEVAVATVNAVKWISGTTYTIGAVVWSPATSLSYRRKTNGAGATDPSSDTTNWERLVSLSVLYSPRTGNVELTQADNCSFVDITSGTFTQTFANCSSLRPGWSAIIRNSGTGDITLDPFEGETIDGIASFIMYPGEARQFFGDGTTLRSVVLKSFYRTFTSSGTFVKPPGYTAFKGLLWSGGASGQRTGNTDPSKGGGGGGCLPFELPSELFGTSEVVTIGAGGAAVTAAAGGNVGGNSSLGSLVLVYGSSSFNAGGGFSPNATTGADGFGGATTAVYNTANGMYGGGSTQSVTGGGDDSGGSVFGGGGGGSISSAGRLYAPGTSRIGGDGGVASPTSNGTAGTIPGGGGGATQTGTQSGAGARGELWIWGSL